jgi:serine/threonine-protein kinase HipA
MTRILNVYLNDSLVGELEQDLSGMMSFKYAIDWLNNPNSIPISYSLPLREDAYKKNECRGFFAGILPEDKKREIIAKNLGISSGNDYAMLERIGGECAGAITFLPSNYQLPEQSCEYLILSNAELVGIIKELPKRPLMAGERGVRLSLAGAQDKIVVTIENNIIKLPLNGAPSTHIIKPVISDFRDIVYNEAFCLQAAKAVGLPVANTSIMSIQDVEFLIIERYDRYITPDNKIARIHQEDFCQALGISPEMKYQSEGGPSLKKCFELIRKVSSLPIFDVRHLLDVVIFNYLIGNNDAHRKNFSLLYFTEGKKLQIRLAPFYDLISTSVYPELSNHMAMKIGEHAEYNKITPRDWEKFAISSGFAPAMVKGRIKDLAQNLYKHIDKYRKNDKVLKVIDLIEERCKKTLEWP